MSEIYISVSTDEDILVEEIVGGLTDKELLNFILRLDEEAADLNFTKELRDALNAAIKEEENG